jgi:hypothetical protein
LVFHAWSGGWCGIKRCAPSIGEAKVRSQADTRRQCPNSASQRWRTPVCVGTGRRSLHRQVKLATT